MATKKVYMMSNWTDLPREEKINKRLNSIIIDNDVTVNNIEFGMNMYKNAIKPNECLNIINSLENEINLNIPNIQWNGSLINYKQDDNYVRNCVDLKFKKENLGSILPFSQTLYDIHELVEKRLDICLNHYEQLWNLKMSYKEAFNFVKYMPGKYFKIHSDHGPWYSCSVSAVIYLNDNYEGGEIYFPRQDLTIKPEAGDILMFPSNFIYEHASLEVFSGIKYSVVVMTDYNDNLHKDII